MSRADLTLGGLLLGALLGSCGGGGDADPAGVGGSAGVAGGGTGGSGAVGSLPFGAQCRPASAEWTCEDGTGVCMNFGGNISGFCSRACTTGAECPPDFRCTDSGAGRVCLERCFDNVPWCTAGGNTCALTSTPDESVCWYGASDVGELTFYNDPAIAQVYWEDAEQGSWRMLPGTQVNFYVRFEERGNRPVNWTYSATSQHSALTVQHTGRGPNGGAAEGTEAFTATVDATAAAGDALALEITLDGGPYGVFHLPMAHRVLPPGPGDFTDFPY